MEREGRREEEGGEKEGNNRLAWWGGESAKATANPWPGPPELLVSKGEGQSPVTRVRLGPQTDHRDAGQHFQSSLTTQPPGPGG